jgi:glycosyltransferase 2 family protein
MADSVAGDKQGPLGSRAGAFRRVAPRVVASLLIAAGFVWALRRGGLPFAPPPHAAEQLHWWGVPAFATLMSCAFYFRTSRWLYLLRPLAPGLRRWRVFGVGLVGFAAVFFAPLRLGEMVRPYMMSQEDDVTFLQAVGTVAAERIIDGLVLVLLTAAALGMSSPLSPLPNHVGALPIPVSLVPRTILLASIMFFLAFVAMATFYFAREPARKLVRAVVGVVSARMAELCSKLIERLAESFGFLPSWQRSAPFLRDTLLYWTFSGLAQFSLLRGVGLDSTVPQAFVTMGVIGLGSLLPAGPGFFGAYQVATYTSLAMFNAESDVLTKGAMFVFASYVTHVALNAVSGGLGFLLLSRAHPSGGSRSP